MGLAFPKGTPRVVEKYRKRVDEEKALREAYKAVNLRDKYHCRACGKSCDPDAPDMLRRGHHHHVTYRSKGGQHDPSNVLTLCALCHSDVHARRLRVIPETASNGANGPMEFWRTNDDGEEFLSRREVAVHQVEKD